MQLTSLKFFYLARYSGLSISQGLDYEYPVLLCRSGLLDYLRLRNTESICVSTIMIWSVGHVSVYL